MLRQWFFWGWIWRKLCWCQPLKDYPLYASAFGLGWGRHFSLREWARRILGRWKWNRFPNCGGVYMHLWNCFMKSWVLSASEVIHVTGDGKRAIEAPTKLQFITNYSRSISRIPTSMILIKVSFIYTKMWLKISQSDEAEICLHDHFQPHVPCTLEMVQASRYRGLTFTIADVEPKKFRKLPKSYLAIQLDSALNSTQST